MRVLRNAQHIINTAQQYDAGKIPLEYAGYQNVDLRGEIVDSTRSCKLSYNQAGLEEDEQIWLYRQFASRANFENLEGNTLTDTTANYVRRNVLNSIDSTYDRTGWVVRNRACAQLMDELKAQGEEELLKWWLEVFDREDQLLRVLLTDRIDGHDIEPCLLDYDLATVDTLQAMARAIDERIELVECSRFRVRQEIQLDRRGFLADAQSLSSKALLAGYDHYVPMVQSWPEDEDTQRAYLLWQGLAQHGVCSPISWLKDCDQPDLPDVVNYLDSLMVGNFNFIPDLYWRQLALIVSQKIVDSVPAAKVESYEVKSLQANIRFWQSQIIKMMNEERAGGAIVLGPDKSAV